MTAPVHPEQLRISIEMGEAYQPSDRLRAALAGLAAALDEAEAAEVEGFQLGNFDIQIIRSLSYDSLAGAHGVRHGGSQNKGGVAPKIESGVVESVFKF